MNRLNFVGIVVLSLGLFLPSLVQAQDALAPDEAVQQEEALRISDAPQTQAPDERVNLDERRVDLNDSIFDQDEAAQAQAKKYLHNFQLSLSFVDVPGFMIDGWFTEHANMWDGRANLGVGLDYILRIIDLLEIRVSLNWSDLQTKGGFWLRTENKNQLQLADFIKQDLSVIALEAAVYGYVDIIPEVSFYYGGGLWGGVVLGDAQAYNIRSSCVEQINAEGGNIQNCSHEPGYVPVGGLPPMIGFVMATVGFKFTLLDVLTLRAEGGFKGYFYGQIGIGAQF